MQQVFAERQQTAWLDGVRGMAALIVLISHTGMELGNGIIYEAPFGHTAQIDDEILPKNYQLFRLPVIRIFTAGGGFAVCIFFILSAFVLSYRIFDKISQGQTELVGRSIASTLFRRWFRLYIPCFSITFLQAVGVWAGYLGAGAVSRKSSFLGQIWDWLKASTDFSNPIHLKSDGWTFHAYEWRLWTIPREWTGSLVVFATCISLVEVRSAVLRAVAIFPLLVYTFQKGDWCLWLFTTGTFMSNAFGYTGVLSHAQSSHPRRWLALVMLSLLMGGVPPPSKLADRPGYEWLDQFTPRQFFRDEPARFWQGSGAAVFILAVSHEPTIRAFFESAVCRYLGRISYALYLTHSLILNLLGVPLREQLHRFFFGVTYEESRRMKHAGFREHTIDILYMVVMLPICMAGAHIGEFVIDKSAVAISKRLHDFFIGSGSHSTKPVHNQDGDHKYLPLHQVDHVGITS